MEHSLRAVRTTGLRRLGCLLTWLAVGCTNQHVAVDSELGSDEPDSVMKTASTADTSGMAGAPSEPIVPADAPQPELDTAPSPPEPMPPSAAPARNDAPPAPPALQQALWPADCERHFMFRAHGQPTAGDGSKMAVAAGAQFVARFYFKPESLGEVQLLKLHASIDNPKVVHHWGLILIGSGDESDGSIRIDEDRFLEPVQNGQGLASGARGGSDLELPPNVGLRVPERDRVAFELEVHYFNAGELVEQDATSVEICVTTQKRPIDAAFHVTGSNAFSLPPHRQTDVAAHCIPSSQREPIHLLSAIPHMHLTGVRSTLILNRKSGEQVTLLDEPYAFAEQRSYRLPRDAAVPDVVLNPGDTLTTICRYDNTSDRTIAYGPRTENEMCEVPLLAWPAGALHNLAGELLGVLTPAEQQLADRYCMDP